MKQQTDDCLYNLLPVVYRQRDLEVGGPLRQLLRVIAEQVDLVDKDIAQLYDNWFIETCDDWVVSYIGDLIGCRPVHEPGALPADAPVSKMMSARREVANTVGFRRRKGTLWLLEQLAQTVAGWPARVVEFGRHLGLTQPIDHLHLRRGGTTDLHSVQELDLIGTAFDGFAHTVDVRGIGSDRSSGAYNVQNVGVYAWRLSVYSATKVPACCLEEEGDHCFTFSILGNDIPLYNLPIFDPEPTDIAGELNLPTPIRRRALELRTAVDGIEQIHACDDYYGENRSLAIWAGAWAGGDPNKPIPAHQIIPADLSGWRYRPHHGHVAVDPELGRIAFPPSQLPERDVLVTYHYAFGMDIGGGEYERPVAMPADSLVYKVPTTEFPHLHDAFEHWASERPINAVIEIIDSGVYEEPIHIDIGDGQNLELRAANGARPVIALHDWHAGCPDALTVTGSSGASFTLDGILIMGRGVELRGKLDKLVIRHCTLVPGWALHSDSRPHHPAETSLAFVDIATDIRIEHSIVGSIVVTQDVGATDPISMRISDSIVDATDFEGTALGAADGAVANVELVVTRCTVLGGVHVHAIKLAENCIFASHVRVARRQRGCMRYSYAPPGSRTPRRFACQPDLVDHPAASLAVTDHLTSANRDALRRAERLRIEPQFVSTRYGEPAYCRLATECADEIRRGAECRSEMGVFHNLYEPQRLCNLNTRLAEFVPAGTNVGVIFAS